MPFFPWWHLRDETTQTCSPWKGAIIEDEIGRSGWPGEGAEGTGYVCIGFFVFCFTLFVHVWEQIGLTTFSHSWESKQGLIFEVIFDTVTAAREEGKSVRMGCGFSFPLLLNLCSFHFCPFAAYLLARMPRSS